MLFVFSCDNDNDIDNLQLIQSISFVPDYADGSINLSQSGAVNIKCLVSPVSVLKGLKAENFTVLVNPIGSEQGKLYTLPASSVDIDESLGMVKLDADLSSVLAENEGQELTVALNINSGETTYTSSFVHLTNLNHSLGITMPSKNQFEMTVVVPIHPSSLEYFDYVVRYSDNRGTLESDTVRSNSIFFANESHATRGGTNNDDCYIRTFAYDDLSLVSTVVVEMIPKEDLSTMVSFNFYTPKPYLFPNVYYSTTTVKRETPYRVTDGLVQTRIDNMSIDSFQKVYGTAFISRCGVYHYSDGYEYFFY